jgi:outer membrane protein insertion porin family
LELSTRLGAVGAFGDSDGVPIYERFFAGGADSVRGYKERGLGPKDPATNDPLGGEAMIVASAAYTFPVIEFLKGAVFFDAGNVWEKEGDFGQGVTNIDGRRRKGQDTRRSGQAGLRFSAQD